MAVILISILPTETFAGPAEDNARVEAYLTRLGLDDLRILHLEKMLSGASTDKRAQSATAVKLADVYAARLLAASSESKESYQKLDAKVRALIQAHPEANTTALQLSLLQADFERAEETIQKWVSDQSDTASRDAAHEELLRIAPQLLKYSDDLYGQRKQIEEKQKNLPDDDEAGREQLRKDLVRVAPLAGRAGYYSGWANYYLGLSQQTPVAAAGNFSSARKSLQKFLDLAELPYKDYDAELIGLQNYYAAQAVVALASTEIAAGNTEDGQTLFKLLESNITHTTVRDTAPSFLLQGLLLAGRDDDALKLAREQINEFGRRDSRGKQMFALVLMRAGFLTKDPTPQVKQLGSLGVEGLTKIGRVDVVRSFFEQYKIDFKGDSNFDTAYASAQLKFAAAEKSKSAADYQAAIALLNKTLNMPGARANEEAAAQCQYRLGAAYFRIGQYEQAGRAFDIAIDGLNKVDPRIARSSAWSGYVAYSTLADKNPKYIPAAITSLERLQSAFPKDPLAKVAKVYIARLKWRQAADAAKERAAGEVYKAVQEFVDARGRDTAEHLPDVLFAGIEVAKASGNLKQAQTFLNLVAPVADTAGGKVAERYHQFAMEVARAAGDADTAKQHETWLGKNSNNPQIELRNAITQANKLWGEIAKANGAEAQSLRVHALDAHRKVVKYLGESAEQIKANKNARVVNDRVAQLELATGQYKEAAARYEKLLAAMPKDKSYLRGAGIAEFEAGMPAKAVDRFRTLLDGVPKGSSDWYEAKYYQLACLAETDPATAKTVYAQFELIHTTVAPPWDSKFAELKAKLKS